MSPWDQIGEFAFGLLWLNGVLIIICFAQAMKLAHCRRKSEAATIKSERLHRQLAEITEAGLVAEEIAAIGLWQYFPQVGRQEWSQGLRVLFGIDGDEAFLPGDGETLLAANGIDLVSQVMARASTCDRFSMRFAVVRLDGSLRTLIMRLSLLRDDALAIRRVIGVVMDLTEQDQREKDLLASRNVALREAREARKLAQTDPLTGLSNRRHVMAELDRLIIRARQTDEPLSVIVLDIDHFKQINDSHGHLVGDEVLCRVGKVLRKQARNVDVVGRIGGEEFVWIAPSADNTIARVLAERLRQSVCTACPTQSLPHVTVSVGFAQLRPDDSGLKVFARADRALYSAKEQGRNMVRMAA